MALEDEGVAEPIVLVLGEDTKAQDSVRNSWLVFDVKSCNCFSEADKSRILAVIDRFPGGLQGFSEHIRKLARVLFDIADDMSTWTRRLTHTA
mmetsp:Transcript_16435/g.44166  ORF Transcript_16435/g.44166 Transcript_16435/m.44166 type:complete len:93 (-) Transcript_16435:124-402(-)